MTVLEQWKQLAARENAAMRAMMGYSNFNTPKPTGRTKAETIDATERQKQIIAMVTERPGMPKAHYLAKVGCSDAQWKKAIGGLLAANLIRLKRRGDGREVTYHLWSEE